MNYTKRETFLIWLDSFPHLEYRVKAEIYRMYRGGSAEEFCEKQKPALSALLGERAEAVFGAVNGAYAEYVLNALHKKNVSCVTRESAAYPRELAEVPCPPLVLYARGNTELLKGEKFSVVGSRKSVPLAIAKTEEFCEKLIKAGFTLVTGLAEGVDAAAVKTALKSGRIISVLAGGFSHVYPKAHAALFEEVAARGLVLSEYQPSVPTEAFRFPVRNRIIAGLGRGLLVMSGAKKSGTAYTAGYADALSKQIFALPYSVNVPSGAGCNELIRRGAYLTECAEDILEFYGLRTAETKMPELSDEEKKVLKALSSGSAHIDELCARLGKRAYELTPVLSLLEIKKLVVRQPGNVYDVL